MNPSHRIPPREPSRIPPGVHFRNSRKMPFLIFFNSSRNFFSDFIKAFIWDSSRCSTRNSMNFFHYFLNSSRIPQIFLPGFLQDLFFFQGFHSEFLLELHPEFHELLQRYPQQFYDSFRYSLRNFNWNSFKNSLRDFLRNASRGYLQKILALVLQKFLPGLLQKFLPGTRPKFPSTIFQKMSSGRIPGQIPEKSSWRNPGKTPGESQEEFLEKFW